MTFVGLLARLAAFDDAALERRLPFAAVGDGVSELEGRPDVDVRYALLFRTLEREQELVVRARTTYRGTEAQRILGLAQVAFGDLRGALAGVSGEQLDHAPRTGEWSAREALVHAVRVERSYRANTAYAIERSDREPLGLPPDRRPQPDPADTAGDGSAVAERFAARRAETDGVLGTITDEQLARPSQWGWSDTPVRVDVRFRLHRFASHIVEHTVQVERALEAAGVVFGDARRTVRRISIARAMHERITAAPLLAALDAEHEERMGIAVPA